MESGKRPGESVTFAAEVCLLAGLEATAPTTPSSDLLELEAAGTKAEDLGKQDKGMQWLCLKAVWCCARFVTVEKAFPHCRQTVEAIIAMAAGLCCRTFC